ncbi:MAG TPA: SH3 domain-containing protein, partial [Pyrinomonadaceae bacterium]|nr:SH3 domain-containing protein [Pyrinomonadaceae bacterium]
VLQAIGDGYARLASNADSVVTMQRERNQTLGKLSPEANQGVARMGQAARLSLQRTLYLMVKAYETTVFKPIDVNWNLDEVFDKITELLKPKKGFDAATINSYAETVAPLFEENKKKVKTSLLKDYGFGGTPNSSLEFGFTAEETPDELKQLRQGYSLWINPLVYGLILPTQQRAKAASFECTRLVFDTSNPQLPMPKSGNAKISIRLDGDGTIRSGEHLYAVRSDAPRVWSWTYHFSNGSVEADAPSLSSLDLLNMILKSDDKEIKQKLAAPPAWSELTINLEFTPQLTPEKRPVLKSLIFVCKVDSLESPDAQRVLDVRAERASEHVVISPADLAGRGDGYGDSYRIYSKADKVKLEATPQIGGRPFSHWDILTSEAYRKEEKSQIELVLNTNTLVYSRYQPLISSGSAIMKILAESDPEMIEAQLDDAEQAALAALIAETKHAPLQDEEVADHALLIRAGADANQPIIGLVPEGYKPTVLEENAGTGDWMKVGYKGLVGYIAKSR